MECRVGSSLAISSDAFLATAQQPGYRSRHTADCCSADLAFSGRLTWYCAGLSRKRLLCVSAVVAGQAAEDLITALVEAEVEGDFLEESEILGFCLLLLIAGNETTTHLISNLLNLLADRPELWSQLREDRSLVDTVIEESLRHESPIQRIPRRTTREVEVSGVTIPAGASVTIYYGAANRDPAAFQNPDEFRLDRDLRNHVAFGTGIHYCLGAPLARAEARITLNTFLDRFEALKRGAAPAVRQTAAVSFFGFHELPLVLST